MMIAHSSFLFHPPSRQKGFTLVEMIVVMIITGIIGGMVAMFIRAPMQGYVDSARRANMTDIADTALRRITRDLRLSLPNSVVVTGTCDGAATTCFLDFLATTGGGRYRAGAGGTNNALDFTMADTSFEVLGAMPVLAANDQIVVYNLGIPGADAYLNDNRATYSANAGGVITFAAGKKFPFESPGQRFQVVHEQVRYICDPAAHTLMRYWGFPIATPSAAVPASGSSALLATNVGACKFTYDPLVSARNGLVTLNLGIAESGETVTLYSAAHVSNVP